MGYNLDAVQPMALALGLLATFVIGSYFLTTRRGNVKGLPLPPGPKGLPLVGNVFDIPHSYAWIKAKELSKTYGG